MRDISAREMDCNSALNAIAIAAAVVGGLVLIGYFLGPRG